MSLSLLATIVALSTTTTTATDPITVTVDYIIFTISVYLSITSNFLSMLLSL